MGIRRAQFLLFATMAAKSTSYLFSKIGMDGLPPMELLGIRFLLAALVMGLLFFRRIVRTDRKTLKAGALAGLFMMLGVAAELLGLTMVPSSTVAFLENTVVLWVVLMGALLARKIPGPKLVTSLTFVLVGVAFLTLKGSGMTLSVGELICLSASFFFALWIMVTGKYAAKADPMAFGFIQMTIIGLLGCAASLILEIPAVPEGPMTWMSLLGLALICTVFSIVGQTMAQKYVSDEETGIYAASVPMMAALLGWLFLGETMTALQLLGALFITASILILQVKDFGNILTRCIFWTKRKYEVSETGIE